MKVGDKKNFGRLATIFQIFSMDATDFGTARDVQQENIYEQKTKVIMNNGRWGRYYISVSLVIFHDYCCGRADILLISTTESLDGTVMKILAMRIRV